MITRYILGDTETTGTKEGAAGAPSPTGLRGARFGRWTVISDEPALVNEPVKRRCHVRCECGQERLVLRGNLIRGKSRSCGCLRGEVTGARAMTHGLRKHPLYGRWSKMKARCESSSSPAYKWYGARGIKVCDRWQSFEAFLEDVGEPSHPALSLDRIDNDGDYEPGNVRWATPMEQMRNSRKARLLSLDGVTKSAAQWAEESGITYSALRLRLKRGWPLEEALSTPLRQSDGHRKEGSHDN